MPGLTLTTNSPEMVARIRKKAPIAQARALNRAGVSANATILSAVSSDTGLKVSTLRERINVGRPATPEHLSVRVYASTKGIPLIQFRARGPEPSRGRGRGVTAQIQGGSVRYPRAFIATMKNGRRGVFERGNKTNPIGRARLPITEKYGPSIYLVALRYRQAGLDRGREALVKNLQSEFRFVLAADTAA
jgi:minor tail protein Z (GPZ)